MELRDHPLMSSLGRHNWPPTWVWIGGKKDKCPRGEAGILRAVRVSVAPESALKKCFLITDYEDSLYMGCLLFDSEPFCRHITELLQSHCGESIQSIGSLDLTYTL